MQFDELELHDLIVAGRVTSTSARLWARLSRPGVHRVELRAEAGRAAFFDVRIPEDHADRTRAWTVPADVPGIAPLLPSTRYRVRLEREGVTVSSATFRTAPANRSTAPRRWTFGAFSCHQPFDDHGRFQDEADSMLRAAARILSEEDAAFVLMMGDQMYADYPRKFSLHDPKYFRTIAPPGRGSLLDCTAEEARAIYQRRHRIFWASESFVGIQRSFATYPMIDDHEVVDNFGTHPDHSTERWAAVRAGALDAAYDYQLSRVLPPGPHGGRPESFDYGFTWGPAAVWMMDVRSQRFTVEDGRTRVSTPAQIRAFEKFLARHAELPLLVVMVPIPVVYVEGWIADTAGQLLGQGSDPHERWSHHSCVEERDRWLGILVAHARRYPGRRVLLLGGDVHSGAAFSIDFDDEPRMHQLTSSAICNTESIAVAWACEMAARSVDSLSLPDGSSASVSLLSGATPGRGRNPFGRLNIGLVDVIDRGDRIAVALRLVSHDGAGNPVTVFDSGELDRPPLPVSVGIELPGRAGGASI